MNDLTYPAAPDDGFQPVRLLQIELSSPLPAVSAVDADTGQSYRRALSLVRFHTQPLGMVGLRFGSEGLGPVEYARQIWAALHDRILGHLRRDGLPEISELGAGGLPGPDAPRCTRERELLLVDAPLVTVVVPTRDRPEHIRTCLASLASIDYPRYEVIVVDNAPSTPATAEIVAKMSSHFNRARYIREDRPGASWARNRGLLEAQGEIVAFTDDDVTVDRYWLAELAKAFGSARNVGCVTGNVLPRQLDTPAQAWFEERGGFSRGFDRHVYDNGEDRPNHPLFPYSAMLFGSGNNMAFRSSVLRAIGGFDPALDPASPARGGEDLAAFFEVIVRGHKLVYEPAAIVHHLHRRDYEGLRRQMYGWGVGFTAFLARSLVTHPRLIPEFTLRLPYGLAALLKGRIPYGPERVQQLTRLYPDSSSQALRREENVGYLHGVPAYVRSRQHVRRLIGRFGGLPVV